MTSSRRLLVYQETLKIGRQLEDFELIGQTLINIGQTYRRLEQYDEAIAAFDEAIDLAREFGQKDLEIDGLVGLARIYPRRRMSWSRSLEAYQASRDPRPRHT